VAGCGLACGGELLDQPLRVTRFKLVHAVLRRQRMDVLPGVAPVSLVLARTDNTVVGLTDVRGYPNLPPPGPLAFICAWPGRGLPTSRMEVDSGRSARPPTPR
jgi:hypothetical protein